VVAVAEFAGLDAHFAGKFSISTISLVLLLQLVSVWIVVAGRRRSESIEARRESNAAAHA